MSSIPSLRPREVARILERLGFVSVRQKGSHRFYVKGAIGISLPMHNKDVKKGLLLKIVKQTGGELEDFLKLL